MTTARVWLSGFLLLGVLLGLPGSLIVAWQYHIDAEPQLIGLHFLCLNTGYVISAGGVRTLLHRVSPKTFALAACGLALGSLTALIFVAPPVSVTWRLLALAGIGLSAGALGTCLLYSCAAYFEERPAAATSQAGLLFGCGCLLATVIVGATYFLGSVQIETALLAVFPLFFLILWLPLKSSTGAVKPRTGEQERLRETVRDLRSIATVLFSLLLFFQFGNEWAIAGWLPLFLIHRLGANPAVAIWLLGAYFLALMTGRLVARKLLSRVNHRRFLIGSIATAMCGFLFLSFAPSVALAGAAAVIIGIAFSPIYPLIAERLDDRFSFHPGFYSGTISIAITGALSIPWLLGFVDASLGMRYVMLLPAFGSVIVLVLSLLLMFEAHLMDDKTRTQKRSANAAGQS
jgi:MFS transporter, FHS family, glucose/mannose:H+ symporter